MTTSSAIRDLFSNDAVGDPPLDDHLVQFYENEDFLSDVVVTFLGTGMAAGEPAVVIATEAHRRVFAERLASNGLDVAEACRSGQLTLLDARGTLERFMVDGSPDRERFGEVVGSIIENRVRAYSPIPVRAYGEMVDLLLQDEKPQAAIALEEMWNALQRQQPFKLLCSYVMGGFYKEADGLHEICKAHGSVLALGPDDAISVNDQHAPTNPFTQDPARRREEAKAFRGSFRELRRAEQELRDRQRERHAGIKRTERLTIIMAAIADAVTADQVFEAVVDQVAQAVEASSAS